MSEPRVKIFDSEAERSDLFWKHSGFPPLQADLPEGALVDVRIHRPTPDHSTVETGTILSGTNEMGIYRVLVAGQERSIHKSDIRPALSKDDRTFIEQRTAQWAYAPERFAQHVANIENTIRHD